MHAGHWLTWTGSMEELTPLVRGQIRPLFRAGEQDEVVRLLAEVCGPGLPGASRGVSARVQCAALKVSAGRMDRLYDAIALAQTDWRDLLVAAGFAHDVNARLNWRD